MTAAERLQAYLTRNDLKQAEFARETGFSYPFVCQLLNGTRRPSLDIAAKLEGLTGIPASAWAVREDAKLAITGSARARKR